MLLAEGGVLPIYRNLVESLPRGVELIITAIRGLNLKWDVHKAYTDVIVRYPQTFDCIVYMVHLFFIGAGNKRLSKH